MKGKWALTSSGCSRSITTEDGKGREYDGCRFESEFKSSHSPLEDRILTQRNGPDLIKERENLQRNLTAECPRTSGTDNVSHSQRAAT